MGSKQASNKEGGPPLHATHPSHGPPATHNLYLHEIARSCISNTQNKKTGRAALRARHLSMCFSLVRCDGGCRWVVVSSFRVMMIGNNIFFLLIIAHFLSRLCAGWLAESPRIRTSRFPKIGRQQLLDGTERAHITTHRIINAFFIFCSASHGR